jgi:hypothetical protein
MSFYSFHKRAFLNPASTNKTSYILAHVENSNEGIDKWGTNLIILGDCDHKATIEFFIGRKVDRRMSLKKIDLLIKVLTAFRAALVKEIALIEKAKK